MKVGYWLGGAEGVHFSFDAIGELLEMASRVRGSRVPCSSAGARGHALYISSASALQPAAFSILHPTQRTPMMKHWLAKPQ